MLINIAIEDYLIEEARQLSDQFSANEVATQALQEYILRRNQQKLLDLFGAVDYHDDYDYQVYRKVTNVEVSV